MPLFSFLCHPLTNPLWLLRRTRERERSTCTRPISDLAFECVFFVPLLLCDPCFWTAEMFNSGACIHHYNGCCFLERCPAPLTSATRSASFSIVTLTKTRRQTEKEQYEEQKWNRLFHHLTSFPLFSLIDLRCATGTTVHHTASAFLLFRSFEWKTSQRKKKTMTWDS